MFSKRIVAIFSLCLIVFGKSTSQNRSNPLPDWEEGILEIHHINTGRGDAAFFILPDGTTLLIDAGDTSETHPRTLSERNAPLVPNASKTAPEWIVDYIRQFSPKHNAAQLDYALITHFHDDHFGEMDYRRKFSKKGDYALTGITQVGDEITIKKLIDRGFYYPINLKDSVVQNKIDAADGYHMIPTLKEYWKFIDYQTKQNGLIHEELKPGALNQIKLVNEGDFPLFKIQNIAVNGKIWTGEKDNYFNLFKPGDYPGENNLSTCIKISYGAFDYFTGGDISGVSALGETDLNSIESHIAPVVGPVDVATLNHHGNRDSQNAYFVRSLRPRVWIQQNWSSDHPGEEVLRRIYSGLLYPGERDVFSTVMLKANKEVIGDKLNQYKSLEGHVVIKVYRGGDRYEIYVLDSNSEKREVKSKFGPYESR